MPANSNNQKSSIPRYLKPYFWDADFAHISPHRHSQYILERILEYGDDRAIRWLRKHYTPAQIGKVVRSSRVLSANTANLWSLLLSIPRSEIQCFSKPFPRPHIKISDSAFREFYLAGGSAAALHLGHRVSVDLDFFTPQAFKTDTVISRLEPYGKLTVQQAGVGTLVGLVAKTQVSFFHYPYPVLETPTEYHGIRVASLLDIALMKITAISQRGKRRDFVDLYFICQSGYSLENLLKEISQKFRTLTYPSYHLLRALVYFDDAENDPRLKMLKPYNWREIKTYFEAQANNLMP